MYYAVIKVFEKVNFLKFMVIIKLKGGIGNQLYIYAFARQLELKKKVKIYFLLNNFRDDIFKRKYLLSQFQVRKYRIIPLFVLKHRFIKKLLKYLLKINFIVEPLSVERSDNSTKEIFSKIDVKKNYHLNGYFQVGEFYLDIADILSQEIIPLQEFTDSTKKWIKKIQNCNSVSIHIRQKWNCDANGDSIAHKHVQPAYSANYYQERMYELAKTEKKICFFIMGDDLKWAKKNLPIIQGCQNIFIDNKRDVPDYEDIFLIAYCKRHISSNSSFCYWGKFLSKYYF